MKFTRNRLIIVGVVLFLVISGAIWLIIRGDDKNAANNTMNSKSVINIAGSRAISPCQALPESSVAKIYGKFGPDSYIDETYYSGSINEAQFKKLGSSAPNDVRCRYLLDDVDNSTVSVKFEQFDSEEKALEDWQQAASFSKTETNRLLDILDAEIPGAEQYNLDPEKLKSASEALRRAVNSIDDTDMSQVIESADEAILYSPNRNGFIALSGDKQITVNYEFGGLNFFDEDRQIAPGEVGQVIDKIKSTFDTIFSNIKNPNLSQAPSPTLRGNTTDKIGETKILDACDVLPDKVLFKSMNVTTVNPATERVSIRKDISPGSAKVTGKAVVPTNSCLKHTLIDVNDESGYVRLDLYYLANEQQASDYFPLLVKESGSNKTFDLQTKASKAKHGDFKIPSSIVQFVKFQQGPYAGSLTILSSNDSETPTKVSEKILQEATNLVIDQLVDLSK